MYQYRYEKDGSVTNCFPVDTDTEIWIQAEGQSLQDLIVAACAKWPGVSVEDISVEVQHHHQYSIYYDLHDSSDYVNYFVISCEK